MVIAIIAILAALLLPALVKAKQNATGAYCLNAQKQLMLCFKFYTDDNSGNILAYYNFPIEVNGTITPQDLLGGGIWPAGASVTVPETGLAAIEPAIKARILLSQLLKKYAPNVMLMHCRGYYGYNRYGGRGVGGVLTLVLIVLLVLWLLGGVQFNHP